MSLNFIKDLYNYIRKSMMWVIVYFVAQTLIWVLLAILVLLYPDTLRILAVVFFFVLAAISFYFIILVSKYARKFKKLKDLLSLK
ncbi:MAG: hypothetical protein ABH826_01250 [Patescibacteria group bacterium]